jgi:hypothetical protein
MPVPPTRPAIETYLKPLRTFWNASRRYISRLGYRSSPLLRFLLVLDHGSLDCYSLPTSTLPSQYQRAACFVFEPAASGLDKARRRSPCPHSQHDAAALRVSASSTPHHTCLRHRFALCCWRSYRYCYLELFSCPITLITQPCLHSPAHPHLILLGVHPQSKTTSFSRSSRVDGSRSRLLNRSSIPSSLCVLTIIRRPRTQSSGGLVGDRNFRGCHVWPATYSRFLVSF